MSSRKKLSTDNGVRKLINGISSGNLNTVINIIALGTNLDITQRSTGDTPLHLVARKGHTAICIALVAAGAAFDTNNARQCTPLLEATTEGHIATCRVLVAAGASIHAKNAYGRTPLEEATVKGHAAICTLLLEAGAVIDSKIRGGRTPLHLAAIHGHPEVSTVLLEAGAAVDAQDKTGRTPLQLAALNGRTLVCTSLLAAGAAVDAKDEEGNSPLFEAVHYSQPKSVLLLLAAGADVNRVNLMRRTALHEAVSGGKEGGNGSMCTALLLEAGAEVDAPDQDGCTPLYIAVGHGDVAVCKALVAAGAGVEATNGEDCNTALHSAASFGNGPVCSMLLGAGAAVDAVNDVRNRTPLYMAACHGHTEVCSLLLQAGASIEGRDQERHAVLFLNYLAATNLLERQLLALQLLNFDYSTPLHGAAMYGEAAACTALVEAGAAVDAQDVEDRTALHRAAEGNHPDVVLDLLSAGADLAKAVKIFRTCGPLPLGVLVVSLAGASRGIAPDPDTPPDAAEILEWLEEPVAAQFDPGEVPTQAELEHGVPRAAISVRGLERAYSSNRAGLACVRSSVLRWGGR